jgi:energy-converting hydrogenase Eha subunit A
MALTKIDTSMSVRPHAQRASATEPTPNMGVGITIIIIIIIIMYQAGMMRWGHAGWLAGSISVVCHKLHDLHRRETGPYEE